MKENQLEWRWCLVGNIVDQRVYGENHELRYGTKNFSSGTKVYVAPSQWGDGGEQLVVLGNPRYKQGLIECVIRREYICNWRLKKIYSPLILKRMAESENSWWDNSDESKELIEYLVDARNEMVEKNKNIIFHKKEDLLLNIDKIHITELGKERIKKNLNLDIKNPDDYFKDKILNNNCEIYREGKNWYCQIDNLKIVINASNYTIVTAHIIK